MKFALRNLLKEKTSLLFYGITIILSFSICQVFLGLLDNSYLSLETDRYNHMFMGSMISLIVIFMSCFLLIYTSQYFIASKSKELGLLRSLGYTLKKMIAYLIYQNTFIFMVFGILGIILSFVMYPLLLLIIKKFIDNQLIIEYLTLSSIKENLGLFLTLYVVVILFNVGYIYRNQLTKLLDKNTSTRNRRMKINSNIYLALYIISFILMITVEHNEVGYVLYSVLCAVGSWGIMKEFLPKFIEHNQQKYSNSRIMIVLGHLSKRLKMMSMFAFMIIIMSTVLISLMCFNLGDNKEFIRIFISFVIIYVFLVISMTYKNFLLIDDEIRTMQYIQRLGIKKNEVKTIIFKELCIYYLILIILPLLYIVVILIRFHIYNQLNLMILVFITIYFISELLISCLFIYLLSIRKVN